ncbi:replication initiator [Streptomyces umbrinus]
MHSATSSGVSQATAVDSLDTQHDPRTRPPSCICPNCNGFASAAVTLGGRDRHGHLRTITANARPATAPAPPAARPHGRAPVPDALLDPITLGDLLRVASADDFDRWQVPDHTRRLIKACKDLDPLYPDRRLWAWAHMLGFRGHFSSKSRRYSTTLGELRQARADFRAAQEREALGLEDREPGTVLVLTDWQYAGHGHTPGESALAATIARDLQHNRETAREALRDQLVMEGVAA